MNQDLEKFLAWYPARIAFDKFGGSLGWKVTTPNGGHTDIYTLDNGVHVTLMWEEGPESHNLVYIERGTKFSAVIAEINHPTSEPELIRVAAMFLEDIE